MKILVVEDELQIASFLVKGLRAQGYAVEHVVTGTEALHRAQAGDLDLVMLDLGLPDLDGSEVLTRLRASGARVPILVLTARDGLTDRVEGLDLGADDYVTKPFAFEELLARVRARLRVKPEGEDGSVLRVGEVELDLRTRRVRLGNEDIELTSREFTLLETFMRHPGQVLSREQLLAHVWEMHWDPGSNVVDVYVGYLRKKLGEDVIQTLRGAGYSLSGRRRSTSEE